MAKEIRMGIVVLISVFVVLAFITLSTIGWVVGSYNTFIVAKQDLKTQWSNVLTEYQRRADLFYNLVQVTKSYKNFEEETMTKVIRARSGSFTGDTQKDMQNLNELDSVFSRMLLVWEQYPNLKAIEQYNKLSEEIQRTENRVQIARSDYNSLIRSYNILISKFPKSILANSWGYKQEIFFENKQDTDDAPKIEV